MSKEPASRDQLKDRVWQNLLTYAVFRTESALTIALILILIFLLPQPFPAWHWWYWVILGAVGEGLLIYASVTDPETGRRVVEAMLREQYNLGALRNPKRRGQLERALDYYRRMDDLVHQTRNSFLRERLAETVCRVDEWTANMYRIAVRLDAYEADRVIAQDLQAVPAELAALEKRQAAEADPAVRTEIAETLASKRAQWQSLQELQGMMEKADLQLERTLSDLGNIYSRLRQIEARDVESGRAQRIADDINEQVQALRDLVRSLDEVYASSQQGG